MGSAVTGNEAIFTQIRPWFNEILRDEQGASLLEYLLIAILVAMASIGGMTFLGQQESTKLDNVAQQL